MGKRAILRALITWQAGKRWIWIFASNAQNKIWNITFEQHKCICQVWVNKLFDLRTWTAGMCYTYNPPNKSDTLLTSRFDNNNNIYIKWDSENFQNFFKQINCSCWRGRYWPVGWLSLPIGRFLQNDEINHKRPIKIVIFSLGFDVYLHEKDQFWPRQGSSDHGDKVLLQIRRLYKEFNTKVNSSWMSWLLFLRWKYRQECKWMEASVWSA